jgi:competence/damage-inducible protein CinA-like protein
MILDPRRAAVVAIGNELIEGSLADTNSGAIAARLAELGVVAEQFAVLGDDVAQLERAFLGLCHDYAIVVASGGLGPTLDDVTREAAAAAAGVPLELSEEVLAWLRGLYRARNRPMPEANVRQARFPLGAQIMPNSCGTAPGFRLWIGGGMLAVLPGPPREMREMLEQQLIPWIRSTCGEGPAVASTSLNLVGLAESQFADQVGDWMDRRANPRLDVTAHFGVLRAKLRASAATREGAQRLLDERARQLRERFAEHLFSEDEPRLEFALGRLLLERGITLATAESCTGGLVAGRITAVPGISAVYREGWVTYSNEAKIRSLGVDGELIARHGAVSSEVAAAMAQGAARTSGARLALSVTGIAGPDGGTAEKPVGLVHYGVCRDGAVSAHERRFAPLDRESIRQYATHTALELLWRSLRSERGR